MNNLSDALDNARTAWLTYDSLCLIAWQEFRRIEPELTEEILRLGFNEMTAARWICLPFPGLDGSPGDMVAAGRSSEIMAAVYRTMGGSTG